MPLKDTPLDTGMTTYDMVVVGSGSAGLTCALYGAVSGLRVLILEKAAVFGGTSAMSGGGIWVPANHVARDFGVNDSVAEALEYIRHASPSGWAETEEPLWQAFATNAPDMLNFVERHTKLEFELIGQPDPDSELPGGKTFGRMVSPRIYRQAPVSRRSVRQSTLPHIFSFREMHERVPYKHPLRVGFQLAPQLTWRWATSRVGQGRALISGLLEACLRHGCTVTAGANVTRLLTEGLRVRGVAYVRNGRELVANASRGVLLATGGFEWNRQSLERYFPGPIDLIGSPPTNEGDGHRLARSIGAELTHMDQAAIHPAIPTLYEGRVLGIPIMFQAAPGAIVVNGLGQRFASEFDHNIGYILDHRDPATGQPINLPAWVIGDQFLMRGSPVLRWYAARSPGWVRQARDIASLAKLINLPADALQATVERFNSFCRQGRDHDYRRGESAWERYKSAAGGPANSTANSLKELNRPPFVAIPFNRSILGTKGGARTTIDAQVLRPDGTIIDGLFCAGNAMANPFGTKAVGAGTTLGPCMTWGYIAARRMCSD